MADQLKPRKPWRTVEDVELATARWVDGFNPAVSTSTAASPAELDAAYHAQPGKPVAG
jgi:putative transposase